MAPAVAVLAVTVAAAIALGKRKRKLPRLLSRDCDRLLVTSDHQALVSWVNRYERRHPPPPAPSDPDTMAKYISRFVGAFLDNSVPQCAHLYDRPLGEWPYAARSLLEHLVYNAADYFRRLGYRVPVYPTPQPF